MGLLLTRHVDQYCIDSGRGLRRALGADRLRATLLEPFADQVAVKTITLDDEYALHAPVPP